MEASVSNGQGQGDAGDGYGGQANGFDGQGFDGAGMDAAAIADQFGQLTDGHEEMRQILAGLQEQLAQPQQEAELPALDLDAGGLEHAGGDPGDAFGDPQADAQELAGHLSAVMDAHTAPIREELGDLRRTHEAAQLIQEFPEMGEGDTIRQVMGLTADFAHVLGRPELAGNLQLARTVYLAGRALEMAQQESDGEVPPAAHIEGGGGAGPGGRGISAAQSIVGAGHANPLPFQ
jgi:hypothetical protein